MGRKLPQIVFGKYKDKITHTYIMNFDTRKDMIRSIVKPNGTYAEIGVFKGEFSDFLYKTLTPEKLILIDYFTGTMGSGDQDGNNFQFVNLDSIYEQLLVTYKDSPNVSLLKGDSVHMLSTLPDNILDMVYLDGDHSYEGVKKDIEIAFRKVKPNGWLMGHDYEMNMVKASRSYQFGVKQAIDEFCSQHGYTVYAKGMDGCVSFAVQIVKAL